MNTLLEMLLLTTPRAEVTTAMEKVANATKEDKNAIIDTFCKDQFMSETEFERINKTLLSSLQSLFSGTIEYTPQIDIQVVFTKAHLNLKNGLGQRSSSVNMTFNYEYKCTYLVNGIHTTMVMHNGTAELAQGINKLKGNLLKGTEGNILSGIGEHLLDKKKILGFPNAMEIFGGFTKLNKMESQKMLFPVFRTYMDAELQNNMYKTEDLEDILVEWLEHVDSKAPKEVYREESYILVRIKESFRPYGSSGDPTYLYAIDLSSGVMKPCNHIDAQAVKNRYNLLNELKK